LPAFSLAWLPIIVQTPFGTMQIQPQRTNNILEQFFRSLKRAGRRRTANGSSSRMLRTMLLKPLWSEICHTPPT